MAMKIYAYGIIDSNNGIPKSLKGLEGMPVFNIPYRDIGIVASNLNGRIQDITPDRAIEHERIAEKLMGNFTILPMRFLTVFNKKEDVLSMLEYYYSDFRKNLDSLRNKVEFGIKVIWSGDTVRERIANDHGKSFHRPPASDGSPGRIFLEEKFVDYIIDKKFEEEADRYIAVVDNYFNKIAVEKKLRKLESKNLLLNASYLVGKERQMDFKGAFERLRNATGDLKYLFSGPWPPYNFIILTQPLHTRAGLRNKVAQWTR